MVHSMAPTTTTRQEPWIWRRIWQAARRRQMAIVNSLDIDRNADNATSRDTTVIVRNLREIARARISRLRASGRAAAHADVQKRHRMAVSETSTARGPVDAQAVVAMLADELRLQTPANGGRRAGQHKGCEVAVDVSIRISPQEPTIGHVQAGF